MTWARLADGSTPYTVLTIGDTKYINNQRYAIEKPIRHDVSISPPVAVTVNLILVNNNKFAVYLTSLFPLYLYIVLRARHRTEQPIQHDAAVIYITQSTVTY